MTEKRSHCKELIEKQVDKTLVLEALGMCRSSYYYRPKEAEICETTTADYDPFLIFLIAHFSGYELTLGYRKATSYLNHIYEGLVHFNRKKVYRHMKHLKMLNARGRSKRKGPAKTDIAYYCAIRSDIRWEADLTTIQTFAGPAYLFGVIDTFDREVIGSVISFRCRADEAVKSLENSVIKRFGENTIPENLTVTVRIDRGCQYTAEDFGKAARKLGITLEFCDVQAPNQKPFIEALFANFKREEVYRAEYRSQLDAIRAWNAYVRWYNYDRPHGSLNNMSPIQFKQKFRQKDSLIAS